MTTTPATTPNILIAEDDPHCRELIQISLEERGHTVAVAGDGIEALEMLENTPSVAVVITDILLPGKEGIGLIRAIRGAFSHIRIVAITGSPHFESIFTLARDFGADSTLKKPFEIEQLCELVGEFTSEADTIRS